MIGLHTADQVRTAERALMATLPPGTLMQRAATGLADDPGLGLAGRAATGLRVVLLGRRWPPHWRAWA
ncbi:hypothetical protein A7K94_0207685, partial [Modestobacter sp. VKM Ac-2676]